MRRLPAALLSLAVPAAVVVAPVVSTPADDPRPVPPRVTELDLPIDSPSGVRAAGGRRTLVLTDQRRTEPFTTVGVSWAADDELGRLAVQIRTRTRGNWTPWTAVEEAETAAQSGPDVSTRAGTEPLWAGPSDGVQVRVDLLAGQAPRDVQLVLVDPGTSPADAGGAGVLGDGVATAATQRPVIRSRAEWGADETIRRGDPSYSPTVAGVAVNHTASSNDYSAAEVPGIIRGFYAYHVKSLGWSDVGYNFLVDKFGRVWEGRYGGTDRPVLGAHAGGFNTLTSGVAMIGTYTSVAPSASMLESVAQVAAWKLSLHGQDPSTSVVLTSAGSTRYASGTQVRLPRIFGHRDVSNTVCPGDAGYARLPALRTRAKQLFDQANRYSPVGSLDGVAATPGAVAVVGWSADPDSSGRTRLDISVDGVRAGSAPADSYRPDVVAAHRWAQAYRGFATLVPAAAGTRTVCVTAANAGLGADVELGCRQIGVPPPLQPTVGSPEGYFDGAAGQARSVAVRGWVVDRDGGSPATVVVTLDGREAGRLVAGRLRPDLATAYPGISLDRGFDGTVPAPAGTRRVCLTALDQSAGSDVSLGCRSVYVRPGTSLALARGNERFLRGSQTDGVADASFRFPVSGRSIWGDWNGDGTRTVGVFKDGVWYLTDDAAGGGVRTVLFGGPGDLPVVGDWDGNGTATFGVVRGGRWYVTDDPRGGTGQWTWQFGIPTDVPVPGDWNGDGRDTAGIFRDGTWYVTDLLGRQVADRTTAFGQRRDVPVAADWDGDGRSTPGVFRAGRWYLTDVPGRSWAETVVGFGMEGDVPLGWR